MFAQLTAAVINFGFREAKEPPTIRGLMPSQRGIEADEPAYPTPDQLTAKIQRMFADDKPYVKVVAKPADKP